MTKETNGTFDVTMGRYDGAEVCELVELFILDKLGERFGKEDCIETMAWPH